MFVVIVVWFCFSSWLAFLIMTDLMNLMQHFLLNRDVCVGGDPCSFTFFWKILEFLGFSIYSSFGRHLCQKCGWLGSELFVRTHISELPGWYLIGIAVSAVFKSVPVLLLLNVGIDVLNRKTADIKMRRLKESRKFIEIVWRSIEIKICSQ